MRRVFSCRRSVLLIMSSDSHSWATSSGQLSAPVITNRGGSIARNIARGSRSAVVDFWSILCRGCSGFRHTEEANTWNRIFWAQFCETDVEICYRFSPDLPSPWRKDQRSSGIAFVHYLTNFRLHWHSLPTSTSLARRSLVTKWWLSACFNCRQRLRWWRYNQVSCAH